ncbi:putative Nonribosomal peptide synthetase 14 [Lasiosphaeris hirsuta]|uniref:Nonribosomal peptide synthetase 14 n=1 Tax=Lasiosphaeris hirsuta TaxID=260670 RepID=A0AA40E808_9PEZI|nr:putative Nonribosomal peptide synthetase 14 [Lasiosphaeris hirsuta]
MAYSHPPNEPIAIIGSGCRFPGNATSAHKLWDLLCEPCDLSKQVPSSRYNAAAFYHPDGEHHGASNVTRAYFLEQDPRLFDSVFFNIAPREAEAIDPQQRLLLETVYEAMESAGLGLSTLRGSATGCYVGVMTGDFAEVVTRDPETFSQYMATGTSRALISNRVSYIFDWHGPSMTIDTACSSSLVAVHLAVQSLRSGESTVACAAGSNLILNPDSFIGETSLHMLSTEGHSKMWDASANGYARGEGVAAVILKTLSKALEDGDRIDALIRETGVNQDGRTQGITLPSPEAQAALIRSTYRRAGLDLAKSSDRCQYFEAHGTGTQAGDPREASAINQAFFPKTLERGTENQKLYVGSIKTVVGHTEGCAGVAGLLKVALALKHKTIPPNQHFSKLNPSVEPSYGNLSIPTTLTPWPAPTAGSVLRASVNSFGFGGTNSHAVLESYQPEIHDLGPWGRKTKKLLAASLTPLGKDFTPLPVLLSANSGPALVAMAKRYVDHMAADEATSLHALATTLQARRSVLPFKISFSGGTRAAILGEMNAALAKAATPSDFGIRAATPTGSPTILGIFTGQGAQWPTMGASLMRHSPLFRRTIAALDDALQSLPDGPAWRLADELTASPKQSRVREAAVSQPACTALQVALVDLISAAGVTFGTVVGHSSGEIAAAYAAGFISGTDAVRIAYYRGLHAKLATGQGGEKGSMMAVGLSIDDATEFCNSTSELKGRVAVAASNAPGSVTLSGDFDAVHCAKASLDRDSVFNRVLQVDTAYHSHHMAPCAEPYLASLRACQIHVSKPKPGCTWISSVHSGMEVSWDQMKEELVGPYWRDNMAQAVLFSQAVEAAVGRAKSADTSAFALEVGPHPALKGPALQTIKAVLGNKILYEGVLDRKRDDVSAFSGALGTLWTQVGLDAVDFTGYSSAFDESAVAESRRVALAPAVANLPAYPWEHRLLYRESRINKQLRSRRDPPHELLGTRTPDDSEHEPRWRNILKPDELPWLRDHRIQGQIIVPGAAYCVMALEAAAAVGRARGEHIHMVELRDLEIIRAISLEDGSEGSETLFSLKTLDLGASSRSEHITADFSLSAAAVEDGIMRRVCTGRLQIHLAADAAPSVQTAVQAQDQAGLLPMNIDRFYNALGDLGLGYTGSFRALSSLERTMDRAAGVIVVGEEGRTLPVHPTWLDASFQTVFAAFAATNDDSLWTAFLPTKIGLLRWFPSLPAASTATATAAEMTVDSYIASFEPASRSSMPRITADLDILDGETGERSVEIHDLTMTAFLPVTAKDDRHVFQRTVWMQDILSGEIAESEIAEPEDERLLEGCEQTAHYYLDAMRSANLLPERYQALPQPAGSTPPAPAGNTAPPLDQREGSRHATDLVDLPLLRAVGDLALLSASSRRPRQQSKSPSVEYVASLLSRWRSGDRLGAARAERSMVRAAEQISHRHPRMDILQLGSYSPRLVCQVVESLGEQFSTYTVTAESEEAIANFRAQAEVDDERLRLAVLDSEAAAGSFDLVLVADPFAAVGAIREARRLLRPGGFLLMVAPTGSSRRLILASLAGDGVAGLSSLSLHKQLQQEGFAGVLSITPDCTPHDYQTTSVVVSQATDTTVDILRQPLSASLRLSANLFQGKVLILGTTSLKTTHFAEALRSRLASVWEGEIVIVEALNDVNSDTLSKVDAVLSLTELDRPVFERLNGESFAKLQQLLRSVKTMLWVTSTSVPSGPYQSAMLGLGRTVMAEDPDMRLQFLNLDKIKGSETVVVEAVLRLIAGRRLETQDTAHSPLWTTEPELAVKQGKILIPRVVMDRDRNDAINSVRRVVEGDSSSAETEIVLVREHDGSQTAHDNRFGVTSIAPLQADLVEIRVSYCSETTIITSPEGLALHICVGATLEGTHVLALSPQNASRIRVPRSLTLDIEDNVLKHRNSDVAQLLGEAVCRLQVGLIFSLTSKGESILIYEPDDALVRVFDEYLEANPKVSAWYINFTPASTRLLPGRYGRRITLRSGSSKREVRTLLPGNAVAMALPDSERQDDKDLETLRKSVSQQCTTLPFSKLPSGLPARSALQLTLTSMATNSLTSRRGTDFAAVIRAADIPSHTRPDHHRRVVVDWTGVQNLKVQRRPLDPAKLFSGTKTYLLVGLTGQIGQSICRWMVRHGARHIVVTSRNPSTTNPWTAELKSLGANIRIEAADVARQEDVVCLRKNVERNMPPITGVMNGAMVLADGVFADMTFENMAKVLRPKIDGSRNLDLAFTGAELDFFVMLSSVNAATGMVGQANYAAANMFMVGLAADRRARGLAASVVDIGMVIGIGIIQRTEGDAGTGVIETNLRRQNLAPISERDLHQMLAEAIFAGTREQDVEIITGLKPYMSSSPNRPAWFRNPRFSHLVTEGGDALQQAEGAGDKELTLASAKSAEEAYQLLESALIAYLASELKLPIESVSPDTPILDLGVDSLVAASLRSWLLSEQKVDVPILKILSGSSVKQVSEEAVSKLSFEPNGADHASKEHKTAAENDRISAVVRESRYALSKDPAKHKVQGVEAVGNNPEPRSTSSSPSGSVVSTPLSSAADTKNTSLTSSAVWQKLQKQPHPELVRRSELSLGQSRLFFSSLYLDDATPFNCTTSYRLVGPLSISRLTEALRIVTQRHDIFRTVFYTDESTGKAMQGVVEKSRFNLKTLKALDDTTEAAAEFQRIHHYAFDLAAGDTFVASLLSHSPQSHTLVFGYHHIIIDGVSWQLFLQDIGMCYRSPSTVANPLPAQCIDFAEQQRQDMETGAYKEKLQFWQTMFPQPPEPLPLFPFAKVTARRALNRYSMRDTMVPVEASLVVAIKRASLAARTTTFHFWLAGFQVLLQRLLDTNDFCLGIVDANRTNPNFAQTIGFLLEIMPVRFQLRGDQRFADVLKQTRTTTYAALGRSGVPIEEIARACGIPADKTHTPFYQVVFNYRMGATKTPDMGKDVQMQFMDYADAKVPFDLAVSVDEKEDGTGYLTISAQEYLYDQESVDVIIAAYKTLLEKVTEDTSQTVSDTPVHDAAQMQRSIARGIGPALESDVRKPNTLSKMIDDWVARDPDAMAVKDLAGRSMTYLQVSRRADAIGLTLHAMGARSGSCVGVLCEASVETVAAILAIHRVGAAYVPMDVYANDTRLDDILGESNVSILIHHAQTTIRAESLARERSTIRLLDLVGTEKLKVHPFADTSRPEDTAFVLYTSGSTGKPKGIPLTHANACTVMAATTVRLGLGREVVLQQSGQGFDAAVWQLFAALAYGGCVIMADNHGDAVDLAKRMADERVTVALLIVSEAHSLLQYGRETLKQCTSWRVVLCGGESFSPNLVDKFAGLNLRDLKVFNAYGPTEASIIAAIGEVDLSRSAGSDSRVPVGGPLPGYGVFIVNEEGNPLPVGWVGEVVVCGPGVARGYLNRPDLTQAKFKRATFLGEQGAPGRKGWDRLYHTGDRGRMLADGSLSILGRIDGDSMVKLRGFRVELDEVASCILETSGGVLTDARVTVRGNSPENRHLVAFVVFSRDGVVDNSTKAEYLRSLLLQLPLPAHMRPAIAVPLEALPFTERGKLDGAALSKIELPLGPGEDIDDDLTEYESKLKQVWRDIIQDVGGALVPIRRDSDFFSVGGNSLLLLRLKAEIRRVFAIEVSLPELFQSNTLQGLAAILAGSTADTKSPIDWEKEIDVDNLLQGIPPRHSSPKASLLAPEGISVILTGASGFLGSALLRRLESDPAISRIHCLAVRNPSRVVASSHKVVIHPGDLSKPLLGLTNNDAADLFKSIHAIIHNGAEVSHMKSYRSLRAANVGSTRELTRLALRYHDRSTGIPAIHYVSTAGVALLTGRDILAEAKLPMEAVPPQDGSLGYISSKWASERLLEALSEKVDGLHVVVHRPSSITGDGVGKYDIVYNVLRFSVELRAVPELSNGFGAFDLIGVETVAANIVGDVLRGQHDDTCVAYMHQSGETIVPAGKLREFLGQKEGASFQVMAFGEWIKAAREAGMDDLVAGFLSASAGKMRMPLLEKDF